VKDFDPKDILPLPAINWAEEARRETVGV
jgi:hypothetical protein